MPDVCGALFPRLGRKSVTIDSFFFRLTYIGTIIILVASACVVMIKEIGCDPAPCSFENYPEGYLNGYCSLQSAFNLRRKITLVKDRTGYDETGNITVLTCTYYQLGFITLLIQAMLLYVPRCLWKLVEGGKMKVLTGNLSTPSNRKGCVEKEVQPLISYFRENLHRHDRYILSYSMCELLNLVNLAVQLQLMYTNTSRDYQFSDIYALFTGQAIDVTHVPGPLLSVTTDCIYHGTLKDTSISGNMTGTCQVLQHWRNDQIQVLVWLWMYGLAIYGIFVLGSRLATCELSSFRWFQFRSSCSMIPVQTMAAVYNRLDAEDCLMLLMLRKNISELHYKELILDIANNDECYV